MKRKLATMLAAATIGSLGMLAAAAPASAEPGICDVTGVACTSSVTLGTGTGVWGGANTTCRFAVDDSNFNNNTYDDGSGVNDNVASLRDRKAGTTRVCTYTNSSYGGGVAGFASYQGANWVSIGSGSSSLRFRTSATC